MAARSRVIILEDDVILRREIAIRINGDPELAVVAEAGDLRKALNLILRVDAQLMLVDLELSDGNALSLIPQARARGLAVLVLTISDKEAHVFDALTAGAGGYLLKSESTAAVASALRSLRDGGAPVSPRIARRLIDEFQRRDGRVAADASLLTVREWEVIELFATGATYAQVAQSLSVTINTVRQHVRNMYEKLHVTSKTEAVMHAQRLRQLG